MRIYYEDTDAGGIVYYANYLKFAERARTEMLRDFGMAHDRLQKELSLSFVVKHCAIDYHHAARLDDLVEIRTKVARVGGASLDLTQQVFLVDQLLVTVDIRLALLDKAMRPRRLPATLIAALKPQSAAGN